MNTKSADDTVWAQRWGGALGTRHKVDLDPQRTALLVIDMQYSMTHREYGIGARLTKDGTEAAYDYYFDRLERTAIPNIQKLQRYCRDTGIEVVFARVASALSDSRDVNYNFRRHGKMLCHVDSREAMILDELAPLENELLITKGSSGIFNGTAFDQIMRNMGIDSLVICGVGTSYCVETAVRNAGDRNFEVVMVGDACAAMNPEQERVTAEVLDGVYCRVKSTDETIALLDRSAERGDNAGIAAAP